MSSILNANIILDEAFKGHIIVNQKTGQRWVNLSALQGPHIYQHPTKNTTELKVAIAQRRAVSPIGETHTISLAQGKDQKGQPKEYCGGAKEFVFNDQQQAPQFPPSAGMQPAPTSGGDIPF
jgi:hypothetical protein